MKRVSCGGCDPGRREVCGRVSEFLCVCVCVCGWVGGWVG